MSCRIRLAVLIGISALTTGLLVGCGESDGLGNRVKINGKVTYKGQTITKGTINFVPEVADGRPAVAEITNGSYSSVTTQTPGDGILPGKYKVAISALEAVDTDGVAKKYTAAPDQVALAKVAATAKSLIPTKYSNAIDSGLTVDVSSGKTTYDFDLKD
ncbi:MAG: hypothetical protein U0794_10700 [Isosphaeraceae bacterium]